MYNTRIPIIVIVCLLGAGSGCSDDLPPIKPNEVQLRIWLIHSENDVLGSPSNAGSRFSQSDLDDVLNKFKSDVPTFIGKDPIVISKTDGSVDFTRIVVPPVDGSLTLLPLCGSSSCNRGVDVDHLFTYVINQEGHWDPNGLNIYFCGQFFSQQGALDQGITFDPRDLGATIEGGSIWLNDHHIGTYQGILSTYLAVNAVEHEFAHFMLDRRNAPNYDNKEHRPVNSNHLLQANQPHPLTRMQGDELSEIRGRLANKTWNSP